MPREPTIVFVHVPLAGHVNPTLPLTAALAARGVAIRALAVPELRATLERAGAAFQDYGVEVPHDHTRPDRNPVKVGAVLAEVTEALYPSVVAALEADPPDLVVHDSMAPWGRLAADRLGLPRMCSTSTFAIHPAALREPRLLLRAIATVAGGGAALRRFARARRRLRDRHGVELGDLTEVFCNRGAPTLVYTSRRFQPHAEALDGEPVSFVGPQLPAAPQPLGEDLERALGGAPVAYCSLGTLYNDRPDVFRACLEAFAGAEGPVLLSVGGRVDPAALAPLPANAVVRARVPQLAVLARARLFVTHGGMNSVSEGLVHGVPLVLVPQTPEQALVAHRVEALGAGRRVRGRATARSIRAAAQRTLEPATRAGAVALRGSLVGAGGVPAAVAAIERELAETGVPVRP